MINTLSLAQLDALSDEAFLSLFVGGEAITGLIVALGQNACGVEMEQLPCALLETGEALQAS